MNQRIKDALWHMRFLWEWRWFKRNREQLRNVAAWAVEHGARGGSHDRNSILSGGADRRIKEAAEGRIDSGGKKGFLATLKPNDAERAVMEPRIVDYGTWREAEGEERDELRRLVRAGEIIIGSVPGVKDATEEPSNRIGNKTDAVIDTKTDPRPPAPPPAPPGDREWA